MAEEEFVDANPTLVQCEITGKWLPEDEVVTLHGKRVGAEGKAILLERLRSGEAMPGESEKPTVLRRFAALFVDGLIFGVVGAVLAALIVGLSFATSAGSANVGDDVLMRMGLAGLVGNALHLAYLTLMHGQGGQTLGKMAAGLKVVRDDGSPIDIRTAAARAMYHVGPNLLSQVFAIVGLYMVSQGVSLVAGLYILASIIVALVDTAKQRAIHDRLAKTRVIRIS